MKQWVRIFTGLVVRSQVFQFQRRLKTGLPPGWVLCLVIMMIPPLARGQCDPGQENTSGYRKTLVVTGFPFLNPSHTSLGDIGGAETRLPQMLANKINLHGEHLALDAGDLTIRSMTRPRQAYASYFSDELAGDYRLNLPDTQFVVSGVIVDAGETIQRVDSIQGFFQRQKAFFLDGKFHHPRRFELQVSVHNHYTGELVLRKRYATTGNWDYRSTRKIGVDNPLFWRSAYGNKIQGVLELVASDIETRISCRPLMARIKSVTGQGVVFAAPQQANLKTGDSLTLYKVDQNSNAALFEAGEGATVTVVGVNSQGITARFEGINQWGVRVGDIVGSL